MILLLSACRAPAPAAITVDPPSGSLAGYEALTVDLSATDLHADDVVGATIGGILAWNLAPDGADRLALYDQGAPSPGPQDVVLVTRDGAEHRFPGAFRYDPPLDPRFSRVVAFGASLTQGVQAGVPIQHGVLHNPPHLVAQALGAYLPLPLLVDPLFPPIGWADIGPPPACEVPDVVQHVTAAAVEVLGALADPDTGLLSFRNARVDPDLAVQDVAVGDTELHSMVYGPPSDPAELFVVKMVYAPDAGIADAVTTSQLDLVEGLSPTVVMSTDPYANDVVQAILAANGVDLTELTPADEIRADLETLIDRLAGTGAEVFLANLPRPTILPATEEKRASEIAKARAVAEAAGDDPDAAAAEAAAEVDAALAEVEAAAVAHGEALAEIAAGYPNVHVVDFAGRVAEVEATGLDVGGEHLTVDKLGGLLSTDGVHFGDVGYGLVAQVFVDTIAEATGVELPPVDLEQLAADDPYGPAAAAAAGVDPAACD